MHCIKSVAHNCWFGKKIFMTTPLLRGMPTLDCFTSPSLINRNQRPRILPPFYWLINVTKRRFNRRKWHHIENTKPVEEQYFIAKKICTDTRWNDDDLHEEWNQDLNLTLSSSDIKIVRYPSYAQEFQNCISRTISAVGRKFWAVLIKVSKKSKSKKSCLHGRSGFKQETATH